jgi:hypothetical protein
MLVKYPKCHDVVIHRCRLSDNFHVLLDRKMFFGTREECIVAAEKFVEDTKLTVLIETMDYNGYLTVSYYENGFRQDFTEPVSKFAYECNE